jgi:hypothetical protein
MAEGIKTRKEGLDVNFFWFCYVYEVFAKPKKLIILCLKLRKCKMRAGIACVLLLECVVLLECVLLLECVPFLECVLLLECVFLLECVLLLRLG